jgi:hypothetical protein
VEKKEYEGLELEVITISEDAISTLYVNYCCAGPGGSKQVASRTG